MNKQSIFVFSGEIIFDVLLGIALGFSTDIITNAIRITLKFPKYTTIIIQIIIISIILYGLQPIIDRYSPYWSSDAELGIVFISFYFMSQKNIRTVFDDLHRIE